MVKVTKSTGQMFIHRRSIDSGGVVFVSDSDKFLIIYCYSDYLDEEFYLPKGKDLREISFDDLLLPVFKDDLWSKPKDGCKNKNMIPNRNAINFWDYVWRPFLTEYYSDE